MQITMNRRRWLSSAALAAATLAASRECGWAEENPATRGYIKLDQNENPYGFSPKVEPAIRASIAASNRYPLRELAELRDLIAEREKVSSNCVIMGAGSTEIFALACLLYAADGKESLVAEPTYGGFGGYVSSVGGKLIRVPANAQWETDLDAMAKQVTKATSLVYICNPNNPTGTIVDGAKLRQFCEDQSHEHVVLVDEAYLDLVDDARRMSMVELVRKNAKVIIARTFSKIYGLAGLRIGYGIATPEITSEMRRMQTTFCAVNRLGIAAARAAYLDVEHTTLSRQRNAEARDILYKTLAQLEHKAISGSQASFIAFEAKGGSLQLVDRLRSSYNIGLRTYQFGGKSWVRASMGTKEEMTALTAALKEIG